MYKCEITKKQQEGAKEWYVQLLKAHTKTGSGKPRAASWEDLRLTLEAVFPQL